ncbi:MAG TPA: hypothetical protein DD393_07375 [Ruminococcaceae bacterium]|jgi:putative iron-only hydrogenase system regulator|nr:hypothetical protein [Oscillospiraceae bacterium]
MKTRVAVMAIILESKENAEQLNTVLHDYREYILGRMGLPYTKHDINIISVALDAPQDIINSLAGKIGRIEGINVKTAYSNNEYNV